MKQSLRVFIWVLSLQAICNFSYADCADTTSKVKEKFRIYVVDRRTNLPLDGAEVKFTNLKDLTAQESITDMNGMVKFEKIDSVAYKIESRYKKEVIYFTVTSTVSSKNVHQSDTIKMERAIICTGHYRIENVYFDWGKSDINSEGEKQLKKLLQILKDNPTLVIEVNGHSDCRGTPQGNMAASERRAKAVADYFIKNDVFAERLVVNGYGNTHLVNRCDCNSSATKTCTEEEHAQNRRVEFKAIRL